MYALKIRALWSTFKFSTFLKNVSFEHLNQLSTIITNYYNYEISFLTDYQTKKFPHGLYNSIEF